MRTFRIGRAFLLYCLQWQSTLYEHFSPTVQPLLETAQRILMIRKAVVVYASTLIDVVSSTVRIIMR